MAEHRPLRAAAPGPLLLAIESATAVAEVALCRGAEVLAEGRSDAGQHHSESLLPIVDRLLSGAGIAIGQVEAFAISIGPGAFTSLRIGLATLKGLAFGSRAPVAAVSTLEALAETGFAGDPRADILAATLDARRGELYAGVYQRAEARARCLLEDGVLTPLELARALPAGARVMGEGAAIFARALAEGGLGEVGEGVDVDRGPATLPSARAVARIGMRELEQGGGVPADVLVPRYVRRAEAEATRLSEPFE